jgi:hypothetical protein
MGRLITPPLRLKYFYFDAKDRRTVERGIGGKYIADTTATSTTTEARVTLKSYGFTAGAKTNKARIRVYGYCTLNPADATMYVNVNGVDVAYVLGLPESESLIFDVYTDLTPNTSVIVKIDVASATPGVSVTVYVTKVYIIAGYALTSTTSVDILTITLDPNNDIYKLKVSGSFVYRVGVRWWVKGNRKTTAPANITSTLADERYGATNLGASDDGDSEVFLRVGIGDYANEFTIRGYVGAEGNVIIITSIYCNITLRGDVLDSYNLGQHTVLVRERGLLVATARVASPVGASTGLFIWAVTVSGAVQVWGSGVGTIVTATTTAIPVWDMPEYTVTTKYLYDDVVLFLNIVVVGG